MEEEHYTVAVILINYNSSKFTIAAVHSIISQTSGPLTYKIVVVDNNSVIEDYNHLAPLNGLTQVQVVRSCVNLGFSAGNMFGVQFVKARYYFFLNNDCLLLNDCLNLLVTFCEKNREVGLCSGQMFDDQLKLQTNFDYFPSLSTKLLGTGLLRLFSPLRYPSRRKVYTQPLKVDQLSGSSLFIPAGVLYQIGGFDTTYFLYCEEEDIAFRINKAGYDVYLVPAARYQHLGGKSTNRNLLIEKEFYISLLYFYKKSYGWLKTILLQVFLFFKLIRKTFRHRNYLILAFFVVSGAPLYHSLRHRQKIVPLELQEPAND